MKQTLIIAPVLLVVIGLLGLFVAGCAPATSVEAALQATETPVPSSEETPVSNEEVPDEEPVATAMLPEPTPMPDANCITCHQDADQLQLLAEEEDVKENLNEGSG